MWLKVSFMAIFRQLLQLIKHTLSAQVLALSMVILVNPIIAVGSPVKQNGLSQEDTPWYDISLIIYAKNYLSGEPEETWPDMEDLNLTKPSGAITLANATELQSILKLNTSAEFKDIERALKRNGTYRILFKEHWRQQVFDERLSVPWYIQGNTQVSGIDEFEGFVTINLKRYLHAYFDLRLHKIGKPEKKVPLFLTPNELADQEILGTNQQMKEGEIETGSIEQISNAGNNSDAMQIIETIQLKQKRRMRSKEIHYIDHPIMGIIIKITPYSVALFE